MTIKQFTTAAKAPEDKAGLSEDIEIEIDDRKITVFGPTSGQLAVAIATAAGYNGRGEQTAASINFFFSLLSEDDQDYFKGRLFDREDDFDVEEINQITKYLFEEWSTHPTKQPSDYAASQSNGGRKSTHRRQAARATAPSA